MNVFVNLGILTIFSLLLIDQSSTDLNIAQPKNLTSWQRQQKELLERWFLEWKANTSSRFRREIVEIAKTNRACPAAAKGYKALVAKLDEQIGSLEVKSEAKETIPQLFSELDKIKGQAKYLGEESRSEEPSHCFRDFRRVQGSLMHRILALEDDFKVEMRGDEVVSVMRYFQDRNLGPIIDLTKNEEHEVELLFSKVFDRMFPGKDAVATNFAHVHWVLTNLGTQTPHLTELVTELVMDKLRSFGLTHTQETLDLAYSARLNQVSSETVKRFPSELQNLFWSKFNCIRSAQSSFKHVLIQDGGTDPESSDPISVTITVTDGYTASNCGWEIKPLPGRSVSGGILFKMIRKMEDPSRTWALSTAAGDQVTLSAEAMSDRMRWKFMPGKRRNSNDIVFKVVAEGSDNTELCQEDAANSYADRRAVLGGTSSTLCQWVLEKAN